MSTRLHLFAKFNIYSNRIQGIKTWAVYPPTTKIEFSLKICHEIPMKLK